MCEGSKLAVETTFHHENSSTQIFVFANINLGQKSAVLDEQICDGLSKLFEQAEIDCEFRYCTTLDELDTLPKAPGHQITIVTNFPPNSTYDEETNKPYFRQRGEHTVGMIEADGYDLSHYFLREILKNKNILSVHVVIGAAVEAVSGYYISSISDHPVVTVKRKADWLNDENPNQSYFNFIVERFIQAAKRKDGSETYDRMHLFAKQFSRKRIGVFSDGNQEFSEEVLSALLLACGESNLRPFLFGSLEELHNASTSFEFDCLLLFSDDDAILQFTEVTVINSQISKVLLISTKIPETVPLPDGATLFSFFEKPRRSLDELLKVFLECLFSSRIPDAHANETALRNYYYSDFAEMDEAGLAQKNRFLIEHLPSLIQETKNMNGTKVYFPSSSISNLERSFKVLPFIAKRSFVSYVADWSPNSPSPDIHDGLEVVQEPIMDLAGREMFSMYPRRLLSSLKSHAELLNIGGVQFVPCPSFSRVSSDNRLDLAPSLNSVSWDILKKIPFFSYNRNAFGHFPVSNIEGHYAIAEDVTNQEFTSKLIREIELPIISSSKPEELAKLIQDEPNSVNAFSEHISLAIGDLVASQDEDIERVRRRLSKEVEIGVRKLDDELNRLNRTNKISLVAGTILTSAVTISAASTIEIPETVLGVLGGGGAVGLASHLLSYRNEIRNHKNSPYYFFKKLGKQTS